MTKDPHYYKGTISVCLECYKPKADPIHLISNELESRVAPVALNPEPPKLPSHVHTCPVCLGQTECRTEDEILNCKLPEHVLCHKCKVLPDTDKEYASWAASAQPCPGHACPGCGKTWSHPYSCKSKSKGLCESCATQSTSNIFRPVNIEQIAQNSSATLSGRESSEIMLEHESFVYNLCHDDHNKLLPDWQEKIHEHRRNIQQLIEKFRCKAVATQKKLVEFQMEETSTLSPEERAQYERDAKKKAAGKAVREKSAPKAALLDKKVAYDKMIKGLIESVSKKRPDLPQDEVVKKAEQIYKATMEVDE
jgi:hypothetical protein